MRKIEFHVTFRIDRLIYGTYLFLIAEKLKPRRCRVENHFMLFFMIYCIFFFFFARGDQILSVNGRSLEGVTHQEAVSILKNCEGNVCLEILS